MNTIDNFYSYSSNFYFCPYCGGLHEHGRMCPEIEEIEYYPNGQIKRIKLRSRGYIGVVEGEKVDSYSSDWSEL